jgi:cell division protein ZipA
MEDNFRNALIILSGVIIAAIFIHGLWTIRKQKNPYKLKASKDKVKPLSRDFDRSGFDQDGVGQVKVLKQDNEPKVESEKDFEHEISLEEISHLENGQNDESYTDLSSKGIMSNHDAILSPSNINNNEGFSEEAVKEEISLEQPMYQQPVTKAKPSIIKPKKVINRKPANKTLSKEEVKRNQMEINFGDGLTVDDEAMPNINIDGIEAKPAVKRKAKTVNQPKESTQLETQVIILSVVMPENHLMSGAALLPSILTLGLKYGEMNIFHRHQDNAGNGAVTFSLANMLNPGSFELDTMETFVTQGVSLFMTLPNSGDPFAAFEQMLLAAKQLAAEFNAQLLDDKRNVMTKQTEQHYVSKIREFDRQHRLASVES